VQPGLDVPEVFGPVDAVEGGVDALRRELGAGGVAFGRVRSVELGERVEAMEDSDRGGGGLPELVDAGVEAAGEKRDFEVGVVRVGESDDADSPAGPEFTEERATRDVDSGGEDSGGVVDEDRACADAETLSPAFGSPVDGYVDDVARHVLPFGVDRSPKGLSPAGNIP